MELLYYIVNLMPALYCYHKNRFQKASWKQESPIASSV